MFLFALITFTVLLLAGRLIYVQLIRNDFFIGKAMDQRLQSIPVDAKRGTIYDRNGIPLAVSVSANAVYAVPNQVKDKESTAAKLSEILDLDLEFVLQRLQKNTASEWIKKRVTAEETLAIHEANLPGIGVVENPERFYPYGSLAPQVLGIVGIDNEGLEGIELFYDSYLRGVKGEAIFERDAVGQIIDHGIKAYTPSIDGADLVLTLDFYIQQIAEKEVRRACLETGSRLGLIVIADPKTGEILANAIYPSYDLLDYNAYPIENRRNITVTDPYEPGSTFKAVTAAAALDSGVATLNTHFFDPGYIKVSGWTIRCWNRGGHGPQSFTQTLENSCNPFYAKLGIDLGGERFYHYLKTFKFGDRLGIDFPGEAPGTVRPPSEKIPLVTWANIGFGQGLTCTPMQLLAAFGAIANDGVFCVPHYVKAIRTEAGEIGPEIPPSERILDQNVANMVSKVLRSVIANGSGKKADVKGYAVAGKTGTAQLVEHGRYSHSKTVTSFAGYAPEHDPRIVGLLVLWEPQGAFYGGIIASPVFARLVEQIMPYLGVKPEQESGIDRRLAVKVPDVLGKPVAEAQRLLTEAGFKVETAGLGSRIIDQIPAPNAEVYPHTTVIIYTDLDYLPVYSELPDPIGV
jgi:stage V sporulation protein D (sporulation-specific penicillin-binding protein)